MIYSVGNMSLNVIRDVFSGEVNDVFICRDISAQTKTCYTLWVVKKHKAAKELLELLSVKGQQVWGYVAGFTYQEKFCFVFDYKQERKLDDFYMGGSYELYTCETICINLIMECIASHIPFPLLYIILKQNRINLEKDYGIYFDYQLDLSEFDSNKAEKDCVNYCAGIILTLLAVKESEKVISYNLLSRKVERETYIYFTDLYKDIKLAAVPQKKKRWYVKVKETIKRNQDRIFRFFLVICLILGIIAAIMILSQLIWGDIPFMRLFINTFKVIGTESLAQ